MGIGSSLPSARQLAGPQDRLGGMQLLATGTKVKAETHAIVKAELTVGVRRRRG